MDLTDDGTRAAVTARLGELYAGRPVLIAPGVLAGATATVGWLRELGCRVLAVATARGAGDVPGPPDCEVVEVTPPATASLTEELRVLDRLAHELPPHAVAAVEAFDPERRGTWLANPFVTSDEPILGRPVAGGRPAAFLALEDKLLAEEVWRAAGVSAAPHRVVPVEVGALARASAEVAGPLGSVWSGDARDGFNGGGNYVRWVSDARDRAAAVAFFAPRCDRVRVLPFLDGVPCSIHGFVLPDGTAALRPVEIAMLRNDAERRFVHGGVGSTWDPPAADREEMRDVVHRVGAHLAAAHGYRGAFGVDGVLTADGFRPTELNTRMSAGLTLLTAIDQRFFTLLQHHLLAGLDTGLRAADLEALVPLMDAHRAGRVVAMVAGTHLGHSDSYPVAWDGAAFRRVDHETGNTLVVADTASGLVAKVEPCVALVPGRRLAHVNAALLAHLDRTYGTRLGALSVAPDRR
jgi:hypothetical protein